jgi:hypothetical protein
VLGNSAVHDIELSGFLVALKALICLLPI